MIDLLLHQLGIKPEDIRRVIDTVANVGTHAREVNARMARIEKHLGITGDLVLPPIEAKAVEHGTGNRDASGSPGGGGGRGRGGGRTRP